MTQDESSEIDITADDDVRYWTERLAVSEFDLRATVADVGTSVGDVAEALGRGVG